MKWYFTPSGASSDLGARVVKETENYTICVTKNKSLIHAKLEKFNGLRLLASWMNIVDEIIGELKNYEF